MTPGRLVSCQECPNAEEFRKQWLLQSGLENSNNKILLDNLLQEKNQVRLCLIIFFSKRFIFGFFFSKEEEEEKNGYRRFLKDFFVVFAAAADD